MSLLDAATKLLPTPSPIKKIYPPQLSIVIGKWNLQKIPSNQEHLTSEGKITRSLKEVSMRFKKRICERKTWLFSWKKGFSSQIRSPSFPAWLPINRGLHIEFSIFDNSANRSVYYFSSLNRLPELREYINSNRWPMLFILWEKFVSCKSGPGSLFPSPSPP